jgi:acetyl esterase/lipase
VKCMVAAVITMCAFCSTADAQMPQASGSRPDGANWTPPGVHAIREIEYAKPGGKPVLLDLYLPEKAADPLPLVVWIHGGAWRGGSKEGCPALRMVARGYAVASLNYRLSQEAIFPAQIEDCKAAIRWLRANAQKHGIDGKRIGVWGGSAGGHLVALLGVTGQTREFDVGDNLDQSSQVQAVCDFFGPADFSTMDSQSLPNAAMKHRGPDCPEALLIGGAVEDNPEKARRVSPVTYVSSNAAPFLIVHGEQDPVVPPGQSTTLSDALKKAGVPVRLHTIPGAGHGGEPFQTRAVMVMIDQFFDRNLRGRQ